jgi:vitamin B12 transporter
LDLSFSGRYDRNSDFEDIGTYRVTGAWTVSEAGTRLRASLGTGHKAPTFSERFGFYPDQFQGNPDLEPEESRGWELGVDQPLMDGRLRLGATWFRQDLRNEINGLVFDPDLGEFGGFTAENLSGRSRRRGVEFTADAEPARDLLLRASYTYTDSRQPAADNGRLEREIRRPRHSGSLNVAYTFAGGRVTADAGLALTGDRTDNFFEVTPPYGVQTVELDGYTLATLALTWRVHPRLSLLARVENAFNSTYEDVLGFNTPGIGAYLGFRARLAPGDRAADGLE